MAYLILNNSEINGITYFDYEFRISQFADDTVFFLKDKSIIEKALSVISIFSRASGLSLNLNKCELLPLSHCNETHIMSIPVKKEVKYLGLTITKDIKLREKNFHEKLKSMEKTLNHWLTRDLSIFGRNILSKAEGISKLVYPCQSLFIPPQNIKKANSIIYNFIWRNKTHYVKKSQLVKNIKKGGLNTLDFESMVGMFRTNWIKTFLSQNESIWFHIPKNIFKKMGGLDFLLRCDYEITKMPVKLSDFHKQVLHYWKMLFTHNFSPHGSTLWNNRTIKINRKTLFKQTWYDKKIIFITDLMDNHGSIMELESFNEKFDLQCSHREYNKVCQAIPTPLLQLIQNTLTHSSVRMTLPDIRIGQITLEDKKCSNKAIRNRFKEILFLDLEKAADIKISESNLKISNKYVKYMKWPISPKVKEVQFKIVNGYYPAAETLKKRFGFEVEPCCFCQTDSESIEHLFFSCPVVTQFWLMVFDLFKNETGNNPPFTKEQILFIRDSVPSKISDLINIVIILGKYHLHSCKWRNKPPSVIWFRNEINKYLSSLKLLENGNRKIKNILEAAELCSLFNNEESL